MLAAPASVNFAVYETLQTNAARTVKDEADPLLPMKGVKNEVELAHDREAHLRDAGAMGRFQKELEERLAAGEELTELTVDEILHKYQMCIRDRLHSARSDGTIGHSDPRRRTFFRQIDDRWKKEGFLL